MAGTVDPLGKITAGDDLLGKIRKTLSGFIGYLDRENRREADKLLRATIASRYEQQWGRISTIQRQMIEAGNLEQVDQLEAAAIKLRTFIDRVKTASYGYAGFFDAVRVNETELQKIYSYDLQLLEDVNSISSAVDNVEASMGSDGLPAAMRHLTTLSQDVIDAYDRRDEVLLAL
ncbi:MAG: hypothetical protein HW404_194 [Anaerolineales bacterium]|jgi:hypothetical protein|nr:hypothetical protein [Anaerolineales bacterium]